MEVNSAIRRHLLSLDEVRGHTGTKIWKDRLEEGIAGTGGKAIVISEQPWWATPDPTNTNEWPTVWVDCYADCTRDGDGLVRATDALDKAKALARIVDRHLHAARGVRWGEYGSNPGLTIVSCARYGRRYLPGAGGRDAIEGANKSLVSDPLSTDESVMIARTIWALDVVHEG